MISSCSLTCVLSGKVVATVAFGMGLNKSDVGAVSRSFIIPCSSLEIGFTLILANLLFYHHSLLFECKKSL